MALLAARCKCERIGRVEALGQEILWPLPLAFVVVEAKYVDRCDMVCFDLYASSLSVALKCLVRCASHRRIVAQCFIDDTAQVGQLLGCLKVELLKVTLEYFCRLGAHLFHRLDIGGKVSHNGLRCILRRLSACGQEIDQLVDHEVLSEDLRTTHHE